MNQYFCVKMMYPTIGTSKLPILSTYASSDVHKLESAKTVLVNSKLMYGSKTLTGNHFLIRNCRLHSVRVKATASTKLRTRQMREKQAQNLLCSYSTTRSSCMIVASNFFSKDITLVWTRKSQRKEQSRRQNSKKSEVRTQIQNTLIIFSSFNFSMNLQ